MPSKYYDPMQVVEVNSGLAKGSEDSKSEEAGRKQQSSQSNSRRSSPVPEEGNSSTFPSIPEGTVSTHLWYAKNISKLTRKNKLTSPVFRVKHRLIGQNFTALKKNSVSGGNGVASGSSSSSGVAGGFFSVVSSLTSGSEKKREEEVASTTTRGSVEEAATCGKTEESVWYFRVIMLKGLEPAEEESGDPYGVFVEFLPNHVPAIAMEGATDKEKKEAEELVHDLELQKKLAVFPQQTKFTIQVRCPEDPEGQVLCAEPATQEINLENKAVAFKTLLKAENVAEFSPSDEKEGEENPAAVSPIKVLSKEGAALIEIKIQTQMPTLEDKVQEKAQQATASFWKGVSALGSTLTSLKESVAKQVSAQLHALESTREEEVGGTDGDDNREATTSRASASTAASAVPWEMIPTRWRTREVEWKQLISEHLPMDELTFTRGPDRDFSNDETVLLAQVGIMAKTIKSANSSFDYDRDVHEGLLKLDALRKQRYFLVPKFIDDETFWRNYFWKCAALGSCSSDEQAKVLITILNTPPEQPQETNPQLEMKPDAFKSLQDDDNDDDNGSDGVGSKAGGETTTSDPENRDNQKQSQSGGATPSSTSPAAGGQYPIFPPFTHGDVAAMVAEASDATSLLQDLISDEKEGTTARDSSMWDAAERSCQSHRKELIAARSKISKFASASPSTKPEDIELLLSPVDAALKSVEGALNAAREHKSQPRVPSPRVVEKEQQEKEIPPQEPSLAQKGIEKEEEEKVNEHENDSSSPTGENSREALAEGKEPEVHTPPRKTPSPASWSDEEKEETSGQEQEAPPEQEEDSGRTGVDEEKQEKEASPKATASPLPASNFDDEFDDFPTIDDENSPVTKAQTQKKNNTTSGTHSANAETPKGSPTGSPAAADAGGSTAKKSTVSSSTDFSKMPWEEDDE